jgi:hypothetical protein
MIQTDYLHECNEHRIPQEDFESVFCIRCFQTECARSQAGKSKFDQRVSTWAERLFTNVPRLDTSDPRYETVSGQRFINIDTSRTPEIRGDWIDPLTVKDDPSPAEAVVSAVIAEKSPAPQPPATGRLPKRMILANAPDQSGKMLSGSPQPAQPDPWKVPEAKPAETVIRPGATVKLRGSGV